MAELQSKDMIYGEFFELGRGGVGMALWLESNFFLKLIWSPPMPMYMHDSLG